MRRHVFDDLENLVHHDGGETHGRLVEQQHFGSAHQCAGHGQHLLLSAAHGAGQLVLAFTQARKEHKHLLHIGRDLGLVVTDVGAHLQVLDDGHAGEHAAPLRHHGQPFLDQVPRAFALDAFAHVFDVAALQRQRASDGFHGGGFAGAIGADQRDQLALVDFKINALDRLDAAVSHLEAGHLEKCVCHVAAFLQ